MKLFTDIKESYDELVNKVTWPKREQLVSSSMIVMIASIIIALVILLMDRIIDSLMHLVYSI